MSNDTKTNGLSNEMIQDTVTQRQKMYDYFIDTFMLSYVDLCKTFCNLTIAYRNCDMYLNSMLYAFDIIRNKRSQLRQVGGYCIYPVSSMVHCAKDIAISNYYGGVTFVYNRRLALNPEHYKEIDNASMNANYTIKIPDIVDIIDDLSSGKFDRFVPVYTKQNRIIDNFLNSGHNVEKILGYNVLRDVIRALIDVSDYCYAHWSDIVNNMMASFPACFTIKEIPGDISSNSKNVSSSKEGQKTG